MKNYVHRTILGLAISVPGLVVQPALAGEYGANYLGQSNVLTWMFLDNPSGDVVGYACLTRDALDAMARTVDINRYEIVAAEIEGAYLRPLNAVALYRQEYGPGLVEQELEPIAEDEFKPYAQLNESEYWYEDNEAVDSLGRACIDGGVTAAINEVERIHNTAVVDE